MLADDVLENLVLTLRLLPGWRLPAPEWDALARLLADLEGALRAGDDERAERLSIEVVEAAPARLGSLRGPGGEPPAPVPDEVRQLVVQVQRAAGDPAVR